MSRPSYRAAIQWIALNDDSDIGDAECGYIVTICMVADMFGKSEHKVAGDVLAVRSRAGGTL